MNLFGTALLLVLVSVITARTTTKSNPCSTECSDQEDSLFKPYKSYVYSYEGESNIDTTNGLYESTGIIIKSTVTITSLSRCEMKLSMSDVQVLDKTTSDGNIFKESPNSDKVKKVLEQNEVFFSRKNDRVKSICMDKDEPIWSENIKKVIIDRLVNQGIQTKEYTSEITSHGHCFMGNKTEHTSYSSTTVKFNYDLKNCKNDKMPTSIFTDLSQLSLFDTTQVQCQYQYENKVALTKIQCTEQYQMIPFRKNANRIRVQIQTRLTKQEEFRSTDPTFKNKNVVETGIQLSQDEIQTDESSYLEVKQVLKEICEQQKATTSSTIPSLFMKLINKLKDLNSKEFKEIYLDILKTDTCSQHQSEIRSIFYDAVSFVNTPASTSVMVELIKSNHISQLDQNVWLASLSFMQQTPTIEMLNDLESLISTDKPTSPMYLGISAATHLYCKSNYQSCLTDPIIKNIISKFLVNLNNDCSQPKDDNKDYLSNVQISLKALGNLKVFNEQVIGVLNKCVSTKSNALAVRISALEVMKHIGCSHDLSVPMSILENNENDSELRINAYLTLMGCADINTVFKVRKILETEQVNQVGSFIWTHLTNIKESTDSLKAPIQELLNNVQLKKVFDISKLKFSRNIEKTFKTKHVGMTFDSNVIFSEKSFLPRSVSLNTTASIFQRPTNLVELSARLEGLEDLLYKLFGPDGYMKKQSTTEDNLALINLLNEMNGNLDIKLFGQQISFIELIRGSLGSVKKYNILEEIINWSQNKQFQINKNIQLIDQTAVIPTTLGFPLQIKLQGSVSMNIKIQSKIDIDGLFRWPMAFNIDNHISPNINTQFNADLILQSPFTKYGMRLNLKSGTNTELKAKIYAKNSEEFSFNIDTLQAKQELISIEGNAFIIHRNNKIKQFTDKMKSKQLCTSETVTRIFGVQLCGVTSFIDPAYKDKTLFYGPFAAQVFVDKQDTQSGYIIRASSKSVQHIDSEDGQKYTNKFIKFEIDTPNSKIFHRRFFGEFVVDFKEKHIKLEVSTPWNQLLMMTNFKFTGNEKKMRLNFQIDKKDIIDVAAEHLVFSSIKGKTINCGITMSMLNFTPIKTKWSLEMTNDQWIFNFNSKGLMKEDTQMKIKVLKTKSTTRDLSLYNNYQVSGFYNSYFGSGKISGIASENYYGHRWDVKLIHRRWNNENDEIMFIFRHKTEDKSSKTLKKYILTTTFAYGKDASNVLKFRTENELSEKHIRTFIKISTGKSIDSVTDVLDMNLYGGYKWKEDNNHYAEGSLSLKLPTKNINYEGRYTSEVGKRLFKLSLVLDKDHQSKLNLKVNYIQPKLYLKNTDFDVTFSIPNSNIDLKWNLVEIDVNRYQYSLQTKYNNYQMQLEGVQTQISRLNHDSSVTIKMPNIEMLPKQVDITFKINLVDLTQAIIQGKIDIPNSKYKYSFDTKFSYLPNNFLQVPSTDTESAVLKYDIEMSSSTKIIKSKFIFTCNPEQFQSYLNINFDKDEQSENQIEFDIHALYKNPNYKQVDTDARITVRYPGNSHSIGFKSEFKYTEMMAQLDFTWNRDQRISIHTMYEIDNSWTQKGLTSSLTIKTPFKGFEQTHFGINAIGQLRYRKVDFECKWGSNKKIKFDVVIYPKSSSDFSLDWKLVTPFQSWNFITMHMKHVHTSQSISSQASLQIGPKRRYEIKFEAANNSKGKNRDYSANVLIESDFSPLFKIIFVHKDDTVHFKTNFDTIWKKTESLTINSDISYTSEDSEFITKGTIDLKSTLNVLKQAKAIWTLDNRNGQFSNDVELLHNNNNVLKSAVRGFYEVESATFKMEFNGDATVTNFKTMKIASNLNYQDLFDFQHQFSSSHDSNTIYSHNFITQSKSLKFKFLIPSTEFKTIDIEYHGRPSIKENELEIFAKVGEKYLIKFDETYNSKPTNDFNDLQIDFKTKFFSDFLQTKEYQNQGTIHMKTNSFKLQMKTTSTYGVLGEVLAELILEPTYKKIDISIKAKNEAINLFFENDSSQNNNLPLVNKIDLSINQVFKFTNKISFSYPSLVDVDMMVRYKTFNKFLRVKHSHNFINTDHIFDTNMFGKRISFINSIQYRGGVAITSKFNCDFSQLNFFETSIRYSKQGEINIVYRGPNDHKYILNLSNLRNKYQFKIVAHSYFQSQIKLDLSKYRHALFEIKTETNSKPIVKIEFNYQVANDPMKHHNELKIQVANHEFLLKNKFENVKWKYLLVESQLKCSYHRFMNYKASIEYKLKPSSHIINLNLVSNDQFIKISSTVNPARYLMLQFNLETSFNVLKQASFELKQTHTPLFDQMTHRAKATIKFNEASFQFDNTIEWTNPNYFTIDLTISGQMSSNHYFIQPISLKFVHQIHAGTIKEDLSISYAQNTNVKAKFSLDTNYKSQFQLETSFEKLKKLIVDLDLKLLNPEEKIATLKIQNNLENLLLWEAKYKLHNKGQYISSNFQLDNSYKTDFKMELTETAFKTKMIKIEFNNPLFKEPLIINAKYNLSEKEFFLTMNGATPKKMSVRIQITAKQNVLKIKYDTHLFHINQLSVDALHQIKFDLSTWFKTSLEFFKSPSIYKITGKFNDNSLEASIKRNREISLKVNILNKDIDIFAKSEGKLPNEIYTIKGKTNLQGWKDFNGQLKTTINQSQRQFNLIFIKDSQTVLDFNFDQKISKSISIRSTSIFQYFKAGNVNIIYDNFPHKLDLFAEAENLGQEPIKVQYKLDGNTFNGKASSPFEWMRQMDLEGSLTTENDETKGQFTIKHNKLDQSITGKLQMKYNSNLLSIQLFTPFSNPYNELSFKRQITNEQYTLEIANQQNTLLLYKLKGQSIRKFQFDLDISGTNSMKDFTWHLSSDVDFQDEDKSVKITTKSYLYEEINVEMILKPNDYLSTFSHQNQQGRLQLIISQYQTYGHQIKTIAELGESKHVAEFSYEIISLKDIFLKSMIQSTFFSPSSSSAALEAHYKHKLTFPNEFDLDAQCKFNDKIIYYKSISWKRQQDNSFDLILKTILSPNDKEYETKFQLTSKRLEIINLVMTATDVLSEPIDIRIVTRLDNLEFTARSPIKSMKYIHFNVRTENTHKIWTQTITFDSNIFNKHQIIMQFIKNDVKWTFQLNTPLTDKFIYAQYDYQNVKSSREISETHDEISSRFSFNQKIQIKFDSQLEWIKKIESTLIIGRKSFDLDLLVNQHNGKLQIDTTKDSIKIVTQSNTAFYKSIELYLQKSRINPSTTETIIKIVKDEQDFQFNVHFDETINSLKYSTKNRLFALLPKSFSGQCQWSVSPITFIMKLKSNDISLLNLEINEDHIFFNSHISIYLTSVTEIKLSLSRSRAEFLLLSDTKLSLLLTRTSDHQIDGAIIINDNQYSMTTILQNTPDSIIFKLSTFKNAVDALLEINHQISKRQLNIDLNTNYRSKSIFKFKLIAKDVPTKTISFETRFLSFNGVGDLTVDTRADVSNVKLFWNILHLDQQLTIGSIAYVWKSSRPLNYLVSINLHKMAFQAQFQESDNGQFKFQISSPLKGFDIDLKWQLTYESDMHKFWCSIDNTIIGEYNVKITLRAFKDPELKFVFSSNRPIVNFKINFRTSLENEFITDTELRLFDWEKISFHGKLSTKDLIELVAILKTPFDVARDIQIKKHIRFVSMFEQSYQMTVLYDGVVNIGYMGNHEINWQKKIIKFQSSFQKENMKLMSVKIDHSGDHDSLDHSFTWRFKEHKFGLKMNGGFKPLFEGKTEIITPFHQTGKIVLMGKQMENGLLIEVGKDKNIASFEYKKEKNIQLIKLTPPKQIGESIAITHVTRRYKRSLDNEIDTDISYGSEKILQWYSNIKTENDQYSANINLIAPKISSKSLKLSLNHKYNEKSVDFDHQFIIKDITENVYRLFGNLARGHNRHMKLSLNAQHPQFGLTHLTLDHNMVDNGYNNHFILKSGDRTIFMHNGNFQIDTEKPHLSGIWNTQIHSHLYKWTASHSGDWKEYIQSLSMDYNDMPYLRYKRQVHPQGTSNTEINIPTFHNTEIKIISDNRQNKVDLIIKNEFHNILIEMANNNGILQFSYKYNNNNISSLIIGYLSKPYYITGNYLQHSANINLNFNHDSIEMKMSTTFLKLTKMSMKLSKNSFVGDIIYNNQPYNVDIKYHYSKDNINVTVQTSLKKISKIEFHVSIDKCKFTFNEYFQTIQYIANENQFQLTGNNNFLPVKRFFFDLNLQTKNKVFANLELNSLSTKLAIEYSKDKVFVEIINNFQSTQLPVNSVKLEMARKVDSTIQYYTTFLSINKKEIFRIQYEIKNQLYSLGLETYLGHNVITSYNIPRQELIISLKANDQYLNINNKVDHSSSTGSKFVTIKTEITSSSFNLQQWSNELKYSQTDSVHKLFLSSKYNSKMIIVEGEFSKSKLHAFVNIDNTKYSVTISTNSINNIHIECIIPKHHVLIEFTRQNTQFSCHVECNKEQLFHIDIKQSPYIKDIFKHESLIQYRRRNIWNFQFHTDFKTTELKLISPMEIGLKLTSDWTIKDRASLAFLLKYNTYYKPIEVGAGIIYQFNNNLNSYQMHIENSYHKITWKRSFTLDQGQQIAITLKNKLSKDQWNLEIKSLKGKTFEMQWQTPTSKRQFKFNQIYENNVRTSMDLNVFDSLKLNLQRNKNSPNSWTGSLTLFSTQIATVDVGKDYIKAIFNDVANENDRMFFKYTHSTSGQWKKDFLSTKQLVLVQKALNIDLNIEHRTVMENYLYSKSLTINHQLIDGTRKLLKFGATIDFTKTNTLILQLDNPILPIKTILKRSQPDQSSLRYEMETQLNDNDKMHGYLLLITGVNPGITTKLHYNPQDETQFIQFHSKYIDDQQIDTHLFIQTKSKQTTYFQFLLRLFNERTVETTFEWKTDMLSQFDIKMTQIQNYLMMRTFSFMDLEIRSLRLLDRYNQLNKMIPDGNSIVKQLNTIMAQFVLEVRSFNDEIHHIVMTNEFYYSTVVDNILEIFFRFGNFYKQIIKLVEIVQVKITHAMQGVIYFSFEAYRTIFSNIGCMMRPIRERVIGFAHWVFDKLNIDIINALNKMNDSFFHQWTSFIKFTMEIKRFTKVVVLKQVLIQVSKTIEIIKQLVHKFNPDSLQFLKHEKDIKKLYNDFVDKLENFSHKLDEIIKSYGMQADIQLGFLTGDTYFRDMGKDVSSIFALAIEQLRNEQYQSIVKDFIRSSISDTFSDFQSKIKEVTYDLVWPYVAIFDMEKNQRLFDDKDFKIVFRYTLPIPMNDLKSLPDFRYVTKKINKIVHIYEAIKNLVKNPVSPSKLSQLKQWFLPSMPQLVLPSIIPQFESYATITKSSVITFDKKIFQLATDACQLLLSKDNRWNKWHIILNQNKQGRSYNIKIRSDTIEISGSDYKIQLNGKPAELPLNIGSTSLIGLGKVMKLIDDELGLTITIDPLNEMLTMGISRWYHGKTRGLFGNNDNEPFNEFINDGSKLISEQVFMQTYNYNGPTCKLLHDKTDQVQLIKKSCPFIRKLACKFIFKCPFSPMSACFKTVDSTNFYHACINSEETLVPLDGVACNSMRQYQAQCSQAGIHVPVPVPCQKCDFQNDKALQLNEFRNIKIKDKASDIVFIVDESDCLNSLQSRLSSVVSTIEREMHAKTIKSVKFGLVTFVDDIENRAMFHTIGQKMMGSSQELVTSIHALKSSNGKFQDIAGAITLASNYPFREHASRHIVMISCRNTYRLSVRLNTISQLLQQKAIHFSLLTDFSFSLKDNNLKSLIFGVDAKNMFSPLLKTGDRNVTTRPNNDQLYQLAMKMNGVAFDYKFLSSNQPLTEKSFINTFVSQISQRATPARSTKCTCVRDGEHNCVPLDVHTIFPVTKVV